MNVKTLCLALLAHGEASGYDLKTRFTDGPFSHFVDASFGSIYSALSKLQDEGLVTLREETTPGKPARKVYQLTEAGKDAFRAALSEPPAPDTYRSPFGIVALCAPFLSREVIAAAIDNRLDQLRQELAFMDEIASARPGPRTEWLLDWGRSHFIHEVAHLESSRERLEALAGTAVPGEPTDCLTCGTPVQPVAMSAAK